MTQHDPRFPTVEEVMARNPYEVIDSPWGEMPAWKVDAIAVGTIAALHHVFDVIRADSAAAMARADADQARTALLKDVLEKLDVLTARFDSVASELETVKAKERADAKAAADAEEERLRQLEEDPLEDPPDIFEYQARNPPSAVGEDDSPAPSGELHSVAPKQEPEVEDDDTDNIGDLPPELAPPSDPVPEPKGSVLPQPTALFGN